MDWKTFSITFTSIFLAEIGDKTQFAAFAAAAKSSSTFSVLLAVVLALSVAGTLGVLLGKFTGSLLNPEWARWASGILFIAVGVWILKG